MTTTEPERHGIDCPNPIHKVTEHWRPALHEHYYYISIYQGGRPKVHRAMNCDHHEDHDRFFINNCYRHEETAQALLDTFRELFREWSVNEANGNLLIPTKTQSQGFDDWI